MQLMDPTHVILALDLASKTGWAHSNGCSGVWDLRAKKDESSGMRLIRLEAKLREVYVAAPFDVVAFESVSVMSGACANSDAVKFISKMQAIVETFVERREDMEYIGLNLQTIKSHALSDWPKGTARNKQMMVKAAKQRWPQVSIVDDNHADALWILDLAKTQLRQQEAILLRKPYAYE